MNARSWFYLPMLVLLVAAAPAQAQLFEKDCADPNVTMFKAKLLALKKDECEKMGTPNGDFFAGTLTNAKKANTKWSELPICLGFGPDITAYLEKNPDACRRLSAKEDRWTEELNQQFLQCTVDGFLSPKPFIWTTSTADVSKRDIKVMTSEWLKKPPSDAWKKLVTVSEMCYVHNVNKAWPVGIKK